MSRYLGPRRRVERRLGVWLPGLTRKTPDERAYPPGQHGPRARRRVRESPYAVRLREKQKLRFYYGVTETQLRNYVHRAAAQKGPTGANLLALLERRLDNVVFRLGLAPTIPAARQLVRHRHVRVGERVVSVPARAVETGERVSVRERSRKHPLIAAGAALGPELTVPHWLERDADGFGGRITGTPSRADLPLDLDEKLVVEFYAR